MVMRLLVAVLTLVGPMPFRVCTCAASTPTQAPADKSTLPASAVPKACCLCCQESNDPEPAEGEVASHDHPDSHLPASGSPHSGHHERNCPVANHVPMVMDAGTPPAPVVSVDCGAVHAPVQIEPSPTGTPVACRAEQPRPPKIPLYLTLLSLRN